MHTSYPVLRITRREGPIPDPGPGEGLRIADGRAWQWLPELGAAEMTREPLELAFATVRPLSDDEVLHPYLGLPSAIIARWLGRLALHGAAFELGGRAVGLLGDREAGKSSLLGQLGQPVVADDILVVEQTRLYSGPASVDLRAEAAARLGGERLAGGGTRPRWRLRPPAAPPELELAAFFDLSWGQEERLEPLGADERLRVLIASAALRPDAGGARALLELAARPMWRFTRRCALERLPAHAQRLLERALAVS